MLASAFARRPGGSRFTSIPGFGGPVSISERCLLRDLFGRTSDTPSPRGLPEIILVFRPGCPRRRPATPLPAGASRGEPPRRESVSGRTRRPEAFRASRVKRARASLPRVPSSAQVSPPGATTGPDAPTRIGPAPTGQAPPARPKSKRVGRPGNPRCALQCQPTLGTSACPAPPFRPWPR